MALEDLVGDLGGLAGLAGEASGGISGLAASLKGLVTQQDAANNGLKQGRDALGHFTAAGKGATSTMGQGFEKMAAGAQAITPALAGLGSAVVSLATGPIPSAQQAMTALGETMGGAITGATEKLGTALAGLGPEGAAAGAAIEAVGAAAGAAVGSMTTLMGLAIEVTEKLGMMQSRFAALAGSAAGGKAVQAMIAHLDLPFATSEVNGWAQSLLAAGVKGKQLEADVKAIAAATALMGESGGAAAETLFKRLGEGGPAADKLLKTFQTGGPKADKLLKEMGLSLNDLGGQAAVAKMTAEQLHEALAKAMQKKGAGPLADLGNSMGAILTKAQEGIRSLFSNLGPAVKPFMAAVKSLFGEFNKGGGVIKALQPIVAGVMSTLFSWGTKAVGVVHDILTWFLASGKGAGVFAGVVSVLKGGWAALVAIFGAVKTAMAPIIALLKAIFSNATVLKGIKAIFTAIAAVVIGLVIAFAAVAAAAAVVVGAIAGAFGAVVGVVMGAVGGIVDALSGFDFSAFVAKMAGMASAGLAAFKGVFGIASPSTVLLEHGEDDMAGAAAQGVDKGAPKLQKSMAKMGDDAKPKGGKGGGKGKGEGGGGEVHYHYSGPVENFDKFRENMTRFLAEIAGEAGAQGATS